MIALGRWFEKGATAPAGALAFYSLFALAPILTLSLALTADVLGDARARVQLTHFLQTLMSREAAQALVALLRGQSDLSLGTVLTLQTLLMLYGASAFIQQLRLAMDGTETQPVSFDRSRIIEFLLSRLISLGFVLIVIVALVLTSTLTSFAGAGFALVEARFGVTAFFLRTMDSIFALIVSALCFFALYRYVPRTRPSNVAAFQAGLLTGFVFFAAKTLLSMYLRHAPLGSAYGAASSLVITLVWLFFVCNLLLLGNELAQAIEDSRVSTLRPLPAGTEEGEVHP